MGEDIQSASMKLNYGNSNQKVRKNMSKFSNPVQFNWISLPSSKKSLLVFDKLYMLLYKLLTKREKNLYLRCKNICFPRLPVKGNSHETSYMG